MREEQRRSIRRSGNLHIDTDGTGDWHLDPTHKNTTSFTRDGVSLNADVDPYVALPTRMQRLGVRAGDPVVLTGNGRSAPGIVGDFGSPGFVEASVAMAHAIGVSTVDKPNKGPVPNTPRGRDVPVSVTIYPSE